MRPLHPCPVCGTLTQNKVTCSGDCSEENKRCRKIKERKREEEDAEDRESEFEPQNLKAGE